MDTNLQNFPIVTGANIGMSMIVSLEGIGTYKSTLIGMDYGHCLMLKIPMKSEIPTKLFQNKYFVVRYIHEANIYGFRTSLISLVKDPVRFFVLDYPREIESLNLRKSERYDCLVPATARIVRADQTPFEWKGFIKDISHEGCSFEDLVHEYVTPEGVELGDIVQLSINFPNEDAVMTLPAEVRNMSLSSSKLQMGLLYVPNSTIASHQQAINAIKSFIAHIQNWEVH